MKPTEGTVVTHGNIVPMLELGSGFDMDLSGRENIYLNGSYTGIFRKEFLDEKFDEILEFSELGEFIEQPIRNSFLRNAYETGFFGGDYCESGNTDCG